jgi:Zn finger protein HypA/HybF involved in hydrogenase expression
MMKCRDCGKEFKYDPVTWLCPGCGSASLQILQGSECYVESIEVDE